MTIKNKTPTARATARSYCRRCLAVMLCCVLVFGLTVPAAPRAKAVIPEVAIAGMADGVAMGGGLAGGPVGAVLGMLVGSACGLKTQSGSTSGIVGMAPAQYVYSSRPYDYGTELSKHLKSLGGQIAEWWDSLVSRFEAKGGVAEGDTFEIPPEVAAAVKEWAASKYDFSGGIVTYRDHLLHKEGHTFVLSDVPTAELDAYTGSSSKQFKLPVNYFGSMVGYAPCDFEAANEYDATYYVGSGIAFRTHFDISDDFRSFNLSLGVNFSRGELTSGFRSVRVVSGSVYKSRDDIVKALKEYTEEPQSQYALLFYSEATHRLYSGRYDVGHSFYTNSSDYLSLEDEALPAIDGSVAATPELEAQRDDPISVVVPKPAGVVDVGGYATPVYDELSPSVLTPGLDVPGTDVDTPAVPGITAGEITGAIEAALPVTGAVAGDAVVGEALAEPDSLGAVFISKFPFSIPWDIAKAFVLLAAPPTPPRFEFNMYSAVDGYGGFHCDSPVVIDFEPLEPAAAIVRWVSTLGFIYALAMGTKRLIWTA